MERREGGREFALLLCTLTKNNKRSTLLRFEKVRKTLEDLEEKFYYHPKC